VCYHLSTNRTQKELEKRFEAKFVKPNLFSPLYYANGFEAPKVPVITNDQPDKIQMLTWGLIPGWVKNEEQAKDIRFKTLNARAESIFSKPSYRSAIKNKRCLVLTDGFYDWRLYGGKKYPYYVYLKSKEPFAFAGIWEQWMNPQTNRSIKTFSIITAKANSFVAKIHNVKKRMPVILDKSEERSWLEDLQEAEVNSLLDPYPATKMQAHPVSKLITAKGVKRNVPGIFKEFKYENLPKVK